MRSLSWRLYRTLNIFRRHPIMRHPLYRREQWRLPKWPHMIDAWLGSGAGGVLLLGCCAYLRVTPNNPQIDCLLPLFCFGIPVWLPLWIVPLSAMLSPAISSERERGTWDLLRSTTQEIDTLIIAKLRIALEALRPVLRYVRAALIVIGLLLGFLFALVVVVWCGLLRVENDALSTEVPILVLLAMVGVLTVAGCVLFLVDRVQQIMCMGTAALAAGTSAGRSKRSALLHGTVAALAVWLAELGLAAIIVRVGVAHQEFFSDSLWVMLFAGPTPGYILLNGWPWGTLVALGVTFGARELALRALWRWALRAAQE